MSLYTLSWPGNNRPDLYPRPTILPARPVRDRVPSERERIFTHGSLRLAYPDPARRGAAQRKNAGQHSCKLPRAKIVYDRQFALNSSETNDGQTCRVEPGSWKISLPMDEWMDGRTTERLSLRPPRIRRTRTAIRTGPFAEREWDLGMCFERLERRFLYCCRRYVVLRVEGR